MSIPSHLVGRNLFSALHLYYYYFSFQDDQHKLINEIKSFDLVRPLEEIELEKAYATIKLLHSLILGFNKAEPVAEMVMAKTSLVQDAAYFTLPVLLGPPGVIRTFSLPQLQGIEEELLEYAIVNLNHDFTKAFELFKNCRTNSESGKHPQGNGKNNSTDITLESFRTEETKTDIVPNNEGIGWSLIKGLEWNNENNAGLSKKYEHGKQVIAEAKSIMLTKKCDSKEIKHKRRRKESTTKENKRYQNRSKKKLLESNIHSKIVNNYVNKKEGISHSLPIVYCAAQTKVNSKLKQKLKTLRKYGIEIFLGSSCDTDARIAGKIENSGLSSVSSRELNSNWEKKNCNSHSVYKKITNDPKKSFGDKQFKHRSNKIIRKSCNDASTSNAEINPTVHNQNGLKVNIKVHSSQNDISNNEMEIKKVSSKDNTQSHTEADMSKDKVNLENTETRESHNKGSDKASKKQDLLKGNQVKEYIQKKLYPTVDKNKKNKQGVDLRKHFKYKIQEALNNKLGDQNLSIMTGSVGKETKSIKVGIKVANKNGSGNETSIRVASISQGKKPEPNNRTQEYKENVTSNNTISLDGSQKEHVKRKSEVVKNQGKAQEIIAEQGPNSPERYQVSINIQPDTGLPNRTSALISDNKSQNNTTDVSTTLPTDRSSVEKLSTKEKVNEIHENNNVKAEREKCEPSYKNKNQESQNERVDIVCHPEIELTKDQVHGIKDNKHDLCNNEKSTMMSPRTKDSNDNASPNILLNKIEEVSGRELNLDGFLGTSNSTECENAKVSMAMKNVVKDNNETMLDKLQNENETNIKKEYYSEPGFFKFKNIKINKSTEKSYIDVTKSPSVTVYSKMSKKSNSLFKRSTENVSIIKPENSSSTKLLVDQLTQSQKKSKDSSTAKQSFHDLAYQAKNKLKMTKLLHEKKRNEIKSSFRTGFVINKNESLKRPGHYGPERNLSTGLRTHTNTKGVEGHKKKTKNLKSGLDSKGHKCPGTPFMTKPRYESNSVKGNIYGQYRKKSIRNPGTKVGKENPPRTDVASSINKDKLTEIEVEKKNEKLLNVSGLTEIKGINNNDTNLNKSGDNKTNNPSKCNEDKSYSQLQQITFSVPSDSLHQTKSNVGEISQISRLDVNNPISETHEMKQNTLNTTKNTPLPNLDEACSRIKAQNNQLLNPKAETSLNEISSLSKIKNNEISPQITNKSTPLPGPGKDPGQSQKIKSNNVSPEKQVIGNGQNTPAELKSCSTLKRSKVDKLSTMVSAKQVNVTPETGGLQVTKTHKITYNQSKGRTYIKWSTKSLKSAQGIVPKSTGSAKSGSNTLIHSNRNPFANGRVHMTTDLLKKYMKENRVLGSNNETNRIVQKTEGEGKEKGSESFENFKTPSFKKSQNTHTKMLEVEWKPQAQTGSPKSTIKSNLEPISSNQQGKSKSQEDLFRKKWRTERDEWNREKSSNILVAKPQRTPKIKNVNEMNPNPTITPYVREKGIKEEDCLKKIHLLKAYSGEYIESKRANSNKVQNTQYKSDTDLMKTNKNFFKAHAPQLNIFKKNNKPTKKLYQLKAYMNEDKSLDASNPKNSSVPLTHRNKATPNESDTGHFRKQLTKLLSMFQSVISKEKR